MVAQLIWWIRNRTIRRPRRVDVNGFNTRRLVQRGEAEEAGKGTDSAKAGIARRIGVGMLGTTRLVMSSGRMTDVQDLVDPQMPIHRMIGGKR
jgi:hypothetical protein